jgi:Uma2 family endonuclease
MRKRGSGIQGRDSIRSFRDFLITVLGNHGEEWKIRVFPEQRVQTSKEHYRVPDVCVVKRTAPFEAIVHTPPLLCIEILSREDRMSEMQERVDDYLGMGVERVWLIDPRRRKAFQTAGRSLELVEELTVERTAIRLPVSDVFAELNELEAGTLPE